MTVLKNNTRTILRKGVHFLLGPDGKPRRYKPWLGDCFAFLYDFIMIHSVFPAKLGAKVSVHHDILRQELHEVQGKKVIELGTGTGDSINFLPNDNRYVGTDISPGLLKRAVGKFRSAGFAGAEFYVVTAADLPFTAESFDLCLCLLSLNFFEDALSVIQEISRVLTHGALLVCAVPVPERNDRKSTIHGTLYTEDELARMFQDHGFRFESIAQRNGTIFYFRALKS
ncbi:class I SAM-dependent methyltransferase [bacterium]|nr:class I SAM-dependent methyltransferase [bacterium]